MLINYTILPVVAVLLLGQLSPLQGQSTKDDATITALYEETFGTNPKSDPTSTKETVELFRPEMISDPTTEQNVNERYHEENKQEYEEDECICTPYYECRVNGTELKSGEGVIDVRMKPCPDPIHVCCYPPKKNKYCDEKNIEYDHDKCNLYQTTKKYDYEYEHTTNRGDSHHDHTTKKYDYEYEHTTKYDYDHTTKKHDYDYDHTTKKHDYDYDHTTKKHDYDYDHTTKKHDYDYDHTTKKHDYDYDHTTNKHDHDYDHTTKKHDYDYDHTTKKHDYDYDHTTKKHDYDYDHTTKKHDYDYDHTTNKHDYDYDHTTKKHDYDYDHTTKKHDYDYDHTTKKHDYDYDHTTKKHDIDEHHHEHTTKGYFQEKYPYDQTTKDHYDHDHSTKKPDWLGCGYRKESSINSKVKSDAPINDAEFGEFPWMVAVLHQKHQHSARLHHDHLKRDNNIPLFLCGGSLIHLQVVLTAAHCVIKKNPEKLYARAGEWDTQSNNEFLPHQQEGVAKVITHKDYYSGGLHNDVALLLLKHPFKFAENVDTICLPPPGLTFDNGHPKVQECIATGWGKESFDISSQYQAILKYIELPIVDRHTCEYKLKQTRLKERPFELHDSFMCAGGVPDRDTCKGDGGGPLFCPIPGEEGKYQQLGITAWGIDCGTETPGVYVDVSKFRKWIDQHMEKFDLHPQYLY